MNDSPSVDSLEKALNEASHTTQTITPDTALRLSHWRSKLPELQQSYRGASPFPHIVIDNFLELDKAYTLYENFPKVTRKGWIHYVHYNEKKHGKNDLSGMHPRIKQTLAELNSPEFVSFLEELTGIKNLLADETYEGGGVHQTTRGGFLNIHADFTVHPHRRSWQRRVNVLVYLNPEWHDEYGGHLELWDRKMKHCEHRVLPLFNRAVIFNTDHDSFHGQPDPLTCPEDNSRKSLALYYFTEENNPVIKSTNYRARPGDGAKSALIKADKYLLRGYDWIKRKVGFNDAFVSDLLSRFDRKK